MLRSSEKQAHGGPRFLAQKLRQALLDRGLVPWGSKYGRLISKISNPPNGPRTDGVFERANGRVSKQWRGYFLLRRGGGRCHGARKNRPTGGPRFLAQKLRQTPLDRGLVPWGSKYGRLISKISNPPKGPRTDAVFERANWRVSKQWRGYFLLHRGAGRCYGARKNRPTGGRVF